MSVVGSIEATPGWFGGEATQRFGWIHVPRSQQATAGVVLCPPFLRDYYAAHSTLRALADRCASSGLVALRFDYFGTGDSSGSQADLEDVESWVADIRAAVDELRRVGVGQVAVVGMRAAATLLVSGADAVGADALVLWDPVTSGRRFLRSIELLSRWEAAGQLGGEHDVDVAPGWEAAPVGGFSKEFLASVAALDLRGRLLTGPALVLTRSGEAPGSLVIDPSERVSIEVVEGQEELLEVYLHDAAIPHATVRRIAEWIVSELARDGAALPVQVGLQAAICAAGEGGWCEHPVWVAAGSRDLFAIVTEPIPSSHGSELTCLFLNSGVQHHVGPDRFYVDMARQLSACGLRSVRVDLSGIGDSETHPGTLARLPYSPAALADIDALVEAFGYDLVATGLCAGGYHALEAIARHPIRMAVSIHAAFETGPLLYDRLTVAEGRQMWTPDSRLVRWLRHSRIGRAIIWRLPGPAWWVLEVLRVQRGVDWGHRRVVAQGRQVVMIVEAAELTRKRSWGIRRRKSGPVIVPSGAQHSLGRVEDRAFVADILFDVVDQIRDGDGQRARAAASARS